MLVRSILIAFCWTVCQATNINDENSYQNGLRIIEGNSPLLLMFMNKLSEMEKNIKHLTETEIDNNIIVQDIQYVADKLDNLNAKIENIERSLTKPFSAFDCQKEIMEINTTMGISMNVLQQEIQVQQQFRQNIVESNLNGKINETNTKLDMIHNEISTVRHNVLEIHQQVMLYSGVQNNTIQIEKLEKLFQQLENDTNIFSKKTDALEMQLKNTTENINTEQKICVEHVDAIQKEVQDIQVSSQELDKKLRDLEHNTNGKWIEIEESMKHVEQMEWKNKAFKNQIVNKTCLCKEQVVKGYTFSPSLEINDTSFKYVSLNKNADNVIDFKMHFAVKAEREAIILLSPKKTTNNGDSEVFEIVMGWEGANQKTALRSSLKTVQATWKDTPNILSATEYKTFTMRISQGKHLEFVENTSEGEKLVIVFLDEKLKNVRYISFAAWADYSAWFRFDCPEWY